MHDLSGNRWYRPGDGGPDQTRCLCSFQVSAAKHRTSSDFFEKTLTLGRACRFSQLVHAPGCKTAALHLLVCGRMLLPTLGPRLERTGFPFLLVRLLVLPQAGPVRLFALVFDIFTYVLHIIYTKPYHTYIHTYIRTYIHTYRCFHLSINCYLDQGQAWRSGRRVSEDSICVLRVWQKGLSGSQASGQDP